MTCPGRARRVQEAEHALREARSNYCRVLSDIPQTTTSFSDPPPIPSRLAAELHRRGLGGLGLADLARRLGLNPATLRRLCDTAWQAHDPDAISALEDLVLSGIESLDAPAEAARPMAIPGVRAEMAAALRAINVASRRLTVDQQETLALDVDTLEHEVGVACSAEDGAGALRLIADWRQTHLAAIGAMMGR